jgi:hypothetical protein
MKKFVCVLGLVVFSVVLHGESRQLLPRGARQPARAPSSVAIAENEEWSAEGASYSLGYESPASGVGILGQNMVIFGIAASPEFWVDLYFGYTKSANTTTVSQSRLDNALTSARTDTTTYGGAEQPHEFSLGVALRVVAFQNSWLQIHAGPIAAVILPSSVSYNTGSLVRTYADKNVSGTYSVSDSIGTVEQTTNLSAQVGLRVGSEFYLRWFPHLALGFSTGLLTTLGGDTSTTTTTRSKTYNVVNNVDQTPSADSTTTTTSDLQRGIEAATFGVGGTRFNLFGTFLIRYVW